MRRHMTLATQQKQAESVMPVPKMRTDTLIISCWNAPCYYTSTIVGTILTRIRIAHKRSQIAFTKLGYYRGLAARGEPLPKRQNLPTDSFVTIVELVRYAIEAGRDPCDIDNLFECCYKLLFSETPARLHGISVGGRSGWGEEGVRGARKEIVKLWGIDVRVFLWNFL